MVNWLVSVLSFKGITYSMSINYFGNDSYMFLHYYSMNECSTTRSNIFKKDSALITQMFTASIKDLNSNIKSIPLIYLRDLIYENLKI